MDVNDGIRNTLHEIAVNSARSAQLLEILIDRVNKLEESTEPFKVVPVKLEHLDARVKKIEDAQSWVVRGVIAFFATSLAGLFTFIQKP